MPATPWCFICKRANGGDDYDGERRGKKKRIEQWLYGAGCDLAADECADLQWNVQRREEHHEQTGYRRAAEVAAHPDVWQGAGVLGGDVYAVVGLGADQGDQQQAKKYGLYGAFLA